jgi:hypothetical protein
MKKFANAFLVMQEEVACTYMQGLDAQKATWWTEDVG